MTTPPPPVTGMPTGAKVVLALLILICVAVIGTLIGGFSSFRALQSPTATTESPATTVLAEPSPTSVAPSYTPATAETVITTSERSSTTRSKAATTTSASVPAAPTFAPIPAGVTPLVSDQAPGSYHNLGVSGPTSAEFAQQVQRDYLATPNQGTVTLQSFSPVTGRTIAMTCSNQGEYVLCTGGANANVYLW